MSQKSETIPMVTAGLIAAAITGLAIRYFMSRRVDPGDPLQQAAG